MGKNVKLGMTENEIFYDLFTSKRKQKIFSNV